MRRLTELGNILTANPELLIPYGGSAVKSAELTLRLATEDTDVLERQRPLLDGHGVPALVGVNVVHARCAARAPR